MLGKQVRGSLPGLALKSTQDTRFLTPAATAAPVSQCVMSTRFGEDKAKNEWRKKSGERFPTTPCREGECRSIFKALPSTMKATGALIEEATCIPRGKHFTGKRS